VNPQGSLLETRHSRRHLVTKGSFYERLADYGHRFLTDDDYAHLYAPIMGRRSIPPSIMMRAMMCATHDNIRSDEEISRRTRVDADWKAAMGVDDEFGGIAASTFALMRARMIIADADSKLFEKTLDKAVAAGVFKDKLVAIIDSSPVHGAGAVHDTYELIRGFLRQVVKAASGRLSPGAGAATEGFVGPKPEIDWQDPGARKAHLGELVSAVRIVVAEVAGLKDPALTKVADLLAKVVEQDTEQDDQGNPQIRRGVAKDRIISSSDPQMRHGRKSASRRFNGYKMDVITDAATELVLGVEIRSGNAGDGEGAEPLLKQVQGIEGIEVETLLADMAYSDGDTRVAVEQAGANLVAKVPPATNRGLFPKTDFTIDLDACTATCPSGVTTCDSRASTDHKGRPSLLFVFAAATCAGCPLRDLCTNAEDGRTVSAGVHEARIAAARAAQMDPKVKALLRQRCKVERKIDHLQDLGMDHARHRGKRRTKLQALLAATVANIQRMHVLGVFSDTGKAGQAA
ncbi:MAG: IS1182 family transposase, partial [Acidobacteriota bacterium]